MNSSLIIILFLFSACGVKTAPRAKAKNNIPSILESYTKTIEKEKEKKKK